MIGPIAQIQAAVAADFQLPVRVIKSREGAYPAPQARQIAMYLAHEKLGKKWAEIGRRLDRDPTTVIHGARRVASCAALRERAEAIWSEIAG